MKPGEKKLSDEDRILWNRIANTAKPLKGKKVTLISGPEPVDIAAMEQIFAGKTAAAPAPAARQLVRERARVHSFDATTRNKLSKGRLPIEGRVDLHGMTQSEAHALLLSFLHRAHTEGMRYVLIITGKGSSFGSDGVLRRAVPEWLATPSFRGLVSSHDSAARRHGGGGAIYVRLRRSGGRS